jgi:hypothetical protein
MVADMEMTKDTKALALEALVAELREESEALDVLKAAVLAIADRIEAALATPAGPVRCDNAKTDEPCEPCIMCNAKGHFGGKFPATK